MRIPPTATAATRKTHGLAHQADSIAAHGAGAEAQHALDDRRQAQAEAGEEGGEEAACDEGDEDEGEDLEGVALGVVGEVAEEALEAVVGAGEEVGAGGAAVVGG